MCSGGACRNPGCTNDVDCTCTIAQATPTLTSCSGDCSANADCKAGLVCSGGMCLNPECTDEADCTCAIAKVPTKTLTSAPKLAELPDAGLSLPTLGVIGGGVVMILLGILLAL